MTNLPKFDRTHKELCGLSNLPQCAHFLFEPTALYR